MDYITNIKTHNKTPNLTLVLPGPCNASCSFCTWKREPDESGFLDAFYKLIYHLPPEFTQISISGGEPTLSPVLPDVLAGIEILKAQGRVTKAVLTTNGSNLTATMGLLSPAINHVNVSRHHYDDETNQNIFKCAAPLYDNISNSIGILECLGIDTNLNCVLNTSRDQTFLSHYIAYAKKIGAHSVTFRNMYNDYSESELLAYLRKHYKATSVSSCPVCRTEEYLANGMKVRCHLSDEEPTSNINLNDELYELILHPDGTLSKDWGKQKPVLLEEHPKSKILKRSTVRKLLREDQYGERYHNYSTDYDGCGYRGC